MNSYNPLLISNFFFSLNFILFLNFTVLYWFCHTSKWIRHRHICVPHPKPSSLLPPQNLWLMPDFWNPASWTFSLLHRDGSISDFYALPCWACNFVYSYKAMSSRMFLTSPVVGLPQFTHCSSLSSHWQFSSQQSLLGESFQACSSTLLFMNIAYPECLKVILKILLSQQVAGVESSLLSPLMI